MIAGSRIIEPAITRFEFFESAVLSEASVLTYGKGLNEYIQASGGLINRFRMRGFFGRGVPLCRYRQLSPLEYILLASLSA